MYKILHKLYSYSAGECSPFKIRYEPGQFTTTLEWLAEAGYHLTVFDTIAATRDFCYGASVDGDQHSLWIVVCEDEISPLPPRLPFSCITPSRINETSPSGLSPSWPYGTRMFKRVKLLERIDWNGYIL